MHPPVNSYIQDHSGSVDECPVCCPTDPIPVDVPPPHAHHHHCPECYEVYECGWECTIEPDLDDPICHPGKKFGAHCPCNACEKKQKDQEKYNSQEFWDKYNGFIK